MRQLPPLRRKVSNLNRRPANNCMAIQKQAQKKEGLLEKKKKVAETKLELLLHKYQYIDVNFTPTAEERRKIVEKAAKSGNPLSAIKWELKKLIMNKDPASAIKIDIAEYREKGNDVPSAVELEAIHKAEIIGGYKGYRIALGYLQGKEYEVGPETAETKKLKKKKLEAKKAEEKAEITTVLDDLEELKELNAQIYSNAVWLADYGLAVETAINALGKKKQKTPGDLEKIEQMEKDLEAVKSGLDEARADRDRLLSKLGLEHLYEYEITPTGKKKLAPLSEEIRQAWDLEAYTAIAGNARYMGAQIEGLIESTKEKMKEAGA